MSDQPVSPHTSPPWSRTVKIGMAITFIVFALLVLWRFQTLIRPLLIAIIMAYLLNPIIAFFDRHTRLNRNVINIVVHVILAIGLVAGFVAVGVVAYNQALNLVERIPAIIEAIPGQLELVRDYFSHPIVIGSFEVQIPLESANIFNADLIAQQLLGFVEPLFSSVGGSLGQFALSTVETFGWLLFILFVSIYVSNDIPRIGSMIGNAATLPGYRADVERLLREFGRIWNAYLRGQAILAVVIGVTVSASLRVLGVENALALGLVSGLLEFIPMVGPFVGTTTAVTVALFQPTNYLGLTNVQLALIVLILMFVIQQVESSVLVPRIVGDALDLPPLLVLVGAIMGSSLAGILGAILAAPVIATLKLIGSYMWLKMFDLPPFPKPETKEGDQPSWFERLWEYWERRLAQIQLSKRKISNRSPHD